ncbi:MAG: aspartate carbamoyltransferase regulatory subunit, partial [Chlamydiia bacterium]|nr:aspartate carbamoyltransferase regulatory subunit [Chlamydiia bacterium]
MLTSAQATALTAIENGTVLDHIPPGEGMRLVRLLQLDSKEAKVLIGLNLASTAMGTKD